MKWQPPEREVKEELAASICVEGCLKTYDSCPLEIQSVEGRYALN